jgi:hypothetical protein
MTERLMACAQPVATTVGPPSEFGRAPEKWPPHGDTDVQAGRHPLSFDPGVAALAFEF